MALFPNVEKWRGVVAIEFAKVHIRRRLQEFTSRLSSIGGSLRQVRETVGGIQDEIDRRWRLWVG